MNENWFAQARFGMFIHWGMYSVPAGIWKGEKSNRIGEQIMRFAEIPVPEYEEIAKQFNPVNFDADAIARLAKEAGMKYLVFTSKHHDGFAMYDSATSDYNIVKATPFHRDVLKELSEACQKHGIRLGIYYSHRQDWHEWDAGFMEWKNQYPDRPADYKVDFNHYMRQKGLPQVRELLTNYGKVSVFWYDTPAELTFAQAKAFRDLVKELQPDCLVCNRVGHNLGDYGALGDNEFPYYPISFGGEVPGTMNHTWGYKSFDHEWKSTKQLLYSLICSVGCDCNYLLNIGPDGLGNVPPASVERLKEMGAWLNINGEAIYGAREFALPTPYEFGYVTAKDKSVYLITERWEKQVYVDGITTPPSGCHMLTAQGKVTLPYRQSGRTIEIDLGEYPMPSPHFGVIELVFGQDLQVDSRILPSPHNELFLFSGNAKFQPTKNSMLRLLPKGVPDGFCPGSGTLQWEFTAPSGDYQAELLTVRHWTQLWTKGIQVRLTCDGKAYDWILQQDEELDNIQKHYHPESLSRPGKIALAQDGKHTATLVVLVMPDSEDLRDIGEFRPERPSLRLIRVKLTQNQRNS